MLDTCISFAFLFLTLATMISCQSAMQDNDINPLPDVLKTRKMPSPRNDFEAGFMHRLAMQPGTSLGRLSERQVEQLKKDYLKDELEQYTPPPITDPNCHVEIQVTQRVPGRCTRLGGRIPACQGQDFVTIDYHECS